MPSKKSMKNRIRLTFKGAYSIWRTIIFLISLAVIVPLSIAKIDNKTFYYTIFFVCALIMLLALLAKVLTNMFKKKNVKAITNYIGLMFHYAFVSLALYFITYLLMLHISITLAHISMVIAAIALSFTISRARVLLVFI
jgi:hypothetical protein